MEQSNNSDQKSIIQLYDQLELLSEGNPPRQTLFVLAKAPLIQVVIDETIQNQLLLIDPPTDVATRFNVEGNVAILHTGPQPEAAIDLPLLQTIPGGVAHIRIGEHLLDVYSQQSSAVVHIPALGILCGGLFGSDLVVPILAEGTNGGPELDTLRLLASLIKKHHLQLYIPRIGQTENDPIKVMARLASDVAYLHSLRRIVPSLVERGDALDDLLGMADALLPSDRHHEVSIERARQMHKTNLSILYNQFSRPT